MKLKIISLFFILYNLDIYASNPDFNEEKGPNNTGHSITRPIFIPRLAIPKTEENDPSTSYVIASKVTWHKEPPDEVSESHFTGKRYLVQTSFSRDAFGANLSPSGPFTAGRNDPPSPEKQTALYSDAPLVDFRQTLFGTATKAIPLPSSPNRVNLTPISATSSTKKMKVRCPLPLPRSKQTQHNTQ